MLCNAIEIKTENVEVEHIRQKITKALSPVYPPFAACNQKTIAQACFKSS